MELRWYQSEAIEAAYRYLRERPGRNPCIVLPTGAGKTPVLSTIANDAVSRWRGRVLVVSHVKELVEQSAATMQRWFPKLDVGVYSAGIGKRDKHNAVVVASIQSVYEKSLELCSDDPFDLILVDEAHRIPLADNGMYRTLIGHLATANPKSRVIGLTATNYRTSGGYVTGDDYILNDVCYEVGVRQLIAQGYLSKLTSKEACQVADLSGVHTARGEFVESEISDAMEHIVETATDEIIAAASDRKSVLLFCAGVKHMESVVSRIQDKGHECYGISGSTSKDDREELISWFKAGRLKFLANVNVLTEGFDAPNVDLVCLLRATLSPGLYYQMVGRGLRTAEGKQDCKVLDFGQNVERHGPIDAMVIHSKSKESKGEAPTKTCPSCKEVVAIQVMACIDCGYEWPEPEDKERHGKEASSAAILSTEVVTSELTVEYATYCVHTKRDAPDDAPKTMRVTYWVGDMPLADEWVCVEHSGFAGRRARDWWNKRCAMEMPQDAHACVEIAKRGGIAETNKIKTQPQPGSRFLRIVGHEIGDIPEPVDLTEELWEEELF
jgi:DNA repair protein RadD